jgi:transposase-like protein
MNIISVDVETNDKLKKAKLENGFYNIIDGQRVSARKTLSIVNPATGKQLAIVPDVDRALLDEAVSAAQKAFPGWRAVPISRRKVILTSMLNRISDHAQELSVLLTAEQGGPLARHGRKSICLLKRLDQLSCKAATKLIYLALRDIVKKWQKAPINWTSASAQFAIQFGTRFDVV